MDTVLGLFFVVVAATIGGLAAKKLKLPGLVGYIIAGILIGAVLPQNLKSVTGLAQVGIILLLFSIGVELSFDRLSRFLEVAVFGAIIQVVLVTLFSFVILGLFKITGLSALVLSLGFSISSTAVLVKILGDRGEEGTIHGEIMFSWSLVQDLLVIPIIVILPLMASHSGSLAAGILFSIIKAVLVIAGVVLLGKKIVPYFIHRLASTNSRELLLLGAITLALGTAAITSLFGISPALGAFLAGVVISESQEHHAVFAETRPLRDLFVALFFVTLGFLVNIPLVFSNLFLIILLTIIILILKAVITFIVSAVFGYKGRTGIAVSFGLAQVGEFAFVIFSSALALNIMSAKDASIGISVTLLSLVASPILYTMVTPFWRKVKHIKIFASGEHHDFLGVEFKDHIIICGYGRVGKWVGKSLTSFSIPFVVVDYNQKVVQELKGDGTPVLYGDPTEPEVLEVVNIKGAKAIVLAIPDNVAQETLIAYVQTHAPGVKIISRVHLDTDWEKLKVLRVDKIVQPEFEGAVEIVKSILRSFGKNKEEISDSVKSLRVSHGRSS
jgi:CPA2 family monovalent cation:H+ antiporter-2